MKKAVLTIIVILGAIVAAYMIGRLQGRSSGFEDGSTYGVQSADLCNGMGAIATLGYLEQTNYTGVARMLQQEIDNAIVIALYSEKHLANVRLPREIQKHNVTIQDNLRAAIGPGDYTSLSVLADFRRKYPSQSEDQYVQDAIRELLEKY